MCDAAKQTHFTIFKASLDSFFHKVIYLSTGGLFLCRRLDIRHERDDFVVESTRGRQ